MPIHFISRFARNLVFGFRRELRPYEATILEQVIGASTPNDQVALRFQFESRERVQRSNERVLFFGFAPEAKLTPIAAIAPDYCYAKIKLRSAEGSVIAKLMTHRGVLSTIEFSKPPAALLDGEFVVESIALHPGGTGYTAEIDASEHGLAE